MLLLWSGGCDSTLLLHTSLQEKTAIRTIGISHTNVHTSERQVQSRRQIIKALKKKGFDWPHNEVRIAHDLGFDVQGGGLTQPIIWLSTAIQFLEKEEDLAMAYIRGDDIWHYWSHVENTFNSGKRFRKLTGNIVVPTEWESKAQILTKLPKYLMRLCWWCETPDSDGDECGRCGSCITHATALLQIEHQLC